jgi:WD40 repeat protein
MLKNNYRFQGIRIAITGLFIVVAGAFIVKIISFTAQGCDTQNLDKSATSIQGDLQNFTSLLDLEVITINNAEYLTSLPLLPHNTIKANALEFSPKADLLVTGNQDGSIQLLALDESTIITTLHDQNSPVASVAFSLDGNLVAAGKQDGSIEIWNLLSNSKSITLQDENADVVNQIIFTPDNAFLIAVYGGLHWDLWNIKTGEKEYKIDLRRNLTGMTLHSNGQCLAFGTIFETFEGTGSVRVWNIKENSELYVLGGFEPSNFPRGMSFSPNGHLLAVGGSDSIIRLWNMSNGQLIRNILGHSEEIFDVAFNPNGTILASASGTLGRDNTVRLWNVETGDQIAVLEHNQAIRHVAFNMAGNLIATLSSEGDIKLWGANSEAV